MAIYDCACMFKHMPICICHKHKKLGAIVPEINWSIKELDFYKLYNSMQFKPLYSLPTPMFVQLCMSVHASISINITGKRRLENL